MIPMIALLAAMATAQTPVRALSVVPAEDGRTEVVIQLDGPVGGVTDFLLSDPIRLVVDLAGARNALPQDRFGDVNRGGVLAIRVGQYQPDVVRVVLELGGPVEYRVARRDGQIRVAFANPTGDFAPWHSTPNLAPEAARQEPATRSAGPAVKAVGPVTPLAAAAPPQGRPQEVPRITIYFQATPIQDVLATFAEFSGRSIIPGEGVSATVNADIRDQPWDVALEAVLQSYGYAIQEMESGIIRVDQVGKLREREQLEALETMTFQIKYANVDSIRPTVQGLLSERGRVTANRATNAIVVTDGRSIVTNRIAPMIQQLDVRTPQVTISAKIIFVDRTGLEDLGFVYDLKDSRGNQLNRLTPGGIDFNGDNVITTDEQVNEDVVRLGGPSIAALANANDRLASPTLQLLTSLVLGRYSLITFIDALTSMSLTDIQAMPTITTMDHSEARVQVGEETPIRVVDAGAATGGGGGGGQAPRANVSFKDTGIILAATPHVTGNQVLLELHTERSNIALAPSDIGVTFQKQVANTQILVNDGETVVISGMTIIEKSVARTGIPILMDLPLIGALFRKSSERETKKDLLIMVTPHIVREGGA